MPSIETLITFFAASVLLALAPGPDNIFVLTQSALRGKGAGIAVTLGLCTGLLGHTAAVTLGLAALFAASSIAFTVLKLCGAAYLLWLAWQAFRASSTVITSCEKTVLNNWQLYRRGILMNITNPKVSIFFLAFLPQFVDPLKGAVSLQMPVLGSVFILATILVFGGIALLAGLIGEWLNRSPGVQKIMNRLTGAVFTGLAIRLAVTQR
jgi:threonine/homoserine/homoserine lactone efflux protein